MKLHTWLAHFSARRQCSALLPWDDAYLLSAAEKARIAASIQQFQLGEGSDGSGLFRRAQASPLAKLDAGFLPALELFIAEEQRHSRHLEAFMTRQGIPCLRKHWIDHVFRRVRKLAGLELCLHVLVTAEIVAVPYYSALLEATASPLLKAICVQILQDEADHLRYQAENLARLRALRQPFSRRAEVFLWRMFMLATLQVVWRHHAKVLRADGRGYRAFIGHCFELLDEVANCGYLPAAPIDNTSPCELAARIAAERESEVLIPK